MAVEIVYHLIRIAPRLLVDAGEIADIFFVQLQERLALGQLLLAELGDVAQCRRRRCVAVAIFRLGHSGSPVDRMSGVCVAAAFYRLPLSAFSTAATSCAGRNGLAGPAAAPKARGMSA